MYIILISDWLKITRTLYVRVLFTHRTRTLYVLLTIHYTLYIESVCVWGGTKKYRLKNEETGVNIK